MARRRLADICTKYKHTDYSMHDFGDEPSPFHFRFQAADDLSQRTACQQAVGGASNGFQAAQYLRPRASIPKAA